MTVTWKGFSRLLGKNLKFKGSKSTIRSPIIRLLCRNVTQDCTTGSWSMSTVAKGLKISKMFSFRALDFWIRALRTPTKSLRGYWTLDNVRMFIEWPNVNAQGSTYFSIIHHAGCTSLLQIVTNQTPVLPSQETKRVCLLFINIELSGHVIEN